MTQFDMFQPVWEYNWVKVSDQDVARDIDILNDHGVDGWEFTGLTSDTGFATMYLMKRRVLPKSPPLIVFDPPTFDYNEPKGRRTWYGRKKKS